MDLRTVALILVIASLVSCGGRDSDRKSPSPADVTPPNSLGSGQSGSSPFIPPDTQTPVENVVEISEADSGKQYITALKEDSQLSEVNVIGLPKNLVIPLGEGPDRIKIGLKKKGKDGQAIPATGDDFIGYHMSSDRIEVDLKADQERVLFFSFFIKKVDSANFSDGEIQFCVIRSKPENIEINTSAHALISSGYTNKSTAEAIYNLAHEKDAAWFEIFKAAYLHRMNDRTTLSSGQVLEFAKTVANKPNGAEWFALYEVASYFASIMPSEAAKRLYAAGFTDMAMSSTEPRKWLDVFKGTFKALQPTTPKWEDQVNAAAKAADQAYPGVN